MILCSGGGYNSVCNVMEGFPAAKQFHKLGITAFVLNYRVADKDLFPAPLEDLAQAYRYIEAHAQAFQVDMEDYAVCGFSAGGHLAAEWGTWYW